MKKLLLLGMMLVGGISSWAGTAPAGTDIYTTDGFKVVVLEDGTVAITWNWNEGDVTIPSVVTDNAEASTGDYKVSAVGNGYAVYTGDKITSLTISEGIKSVGASAFYGQKGIVSLNLPSTLTEIGGYAFEDCTGLTSIHSAAATAPTLGDDVFKTTTEGMEWDHIGQHCALYVPEGSASKYKKGTPWTYWDIFWYVLEPATVTIGKDGYATYFNWYGYQLPAGVSAYSVTQGAEGKVTLQQAYGEGEEVAKNAGLVLKGTPNETYTFELLPFATAAAPAGNLLKGLQDAGNIKAEEGSYYYYKLADGDKGLGFYWGATNGGVFDLAANKAYLALPQSVTTARFIGLNSTSTGIFNVKTSNAKANEIYTISGMKVTQSLSSLPQGIYIVNGKKVVRK